MTKTPFTMTIIFKYMIDMRIVISAFILLAFVSCNQPEEKSDVKQEMTKADSVKVFLLSMDSAKKTVALPAELLPYENVQIRAKVAGYIRKMNVDIGSMVNKGQVLALIDAPEIDSRVQELNEKVKAAKSRYQSSRDYFDRINIASQTDGVIAPSELQRVKNQMMADSSELTASSFAAASYRQVGGYLAVIAPYAGIISKRNIEIGSYVGNPGEKPLFELQDNRNLRLSVPVPEIYTESILLNNSCELTTRSLPNKKFRALLIRKAGSIDHETRSEVWEFEVPNKTLELKAGSYADVKLNFLRPAKSFTVPVSALVTTLERKFIIRVTGMATQWVDVRTGFNMGDKQEIFGELHVGDTLVLKPTEELKGGIQVAIKL
jgi:RND family efflux transporter MFP subunit